MKQLLFIATFLTSGLCFGQKETSNDATRFNKYLSENTQSFVFNGQKPVGAGWSSLENLFETNQFVGWGEYHNSALFSQLTTFALESAAKNGFKTWCTETSPFVASELTRLSKSKSPVDSIVTLNKPMRIFPFFSTAADAQMLTTAAKLGITIWGIDQEFQQTFPYCLEKIYAAQPLPTKTKFRAVYDSLQARWWMPKAKLLDSLKNAVVQPEFKALIDGIALSKKIYSPENDDWYLANTTRAALMKTHFYTYIYASPKTEKVFFKMGANHLAKGINMTTRLYDIGNSVSEYAQQIKAGYANVLFVLRYNTEKGKIVDDLESSDRDYPKAFLNLYDKEKWIVVDLKPLRRNIYGDGSLEKDVYDTIDKYDFVVVSPEIRK